MALSYTQTKSTLDLIADQSENARESLVNLTAELNNTISVLNDLETNYTTFVAEVDTTATANSGDPLWQNIKAEKDKIVADFIAVRTTANNMLTALNTGT